MLKLKLKQVLLSQGKINPLTWLKTNCNLSYRKAYNLLNNKQKSIAYEDLSKICNVLQCTPDEIFWWEDSKIKLIHEWHPLKAKLTPPDKDSNWAKRIAALNPDRVEILRKTMEKLEADKINDEKTIYEAVQQKEREQKEEEQDKDLDAATPLD